eukprot:TRINITY_DN20131_c0_g1_i1.p2 TRINITY_DN20131_c0_g1~~TRINITY_DN20131_c0_g1_i1.p2  ORF type:complete len:178 (+),score=74.54 TRINITY_DN20131_c0_g1_i1:75-536(+)
MPARSSRGGGYGSGYGGGGHGGYDQGDPQEQEALLAAADAKPRGGDLRVKHREAVDNDRLISERGGRIEDIEQDVSDIFDMMQKMDMMVAEQGEQMDTATGNIDAAVKHAQDGRREVRAAEVRAQRTRRRQCWVATCMATAAVIVILWATRSI